MSCAASSARGADGAFGPAGRLDQDAAFGVEVRIGDIHFQQESVKLGFGQGIGTFLLDRVLCGQHMKGRRQVVAHAGNRDMALLHGLQQGRLGARAGAVDLVRHQELGENRALEEAERTLAGHALVHHFRTENVGRHQVRRELDALIRQAERRAHRLNEARLGEARRADQQGVTAREHGCQC